MNIFKLLDASYTNFTNTLRTYLNTTLSKYSTSYGNQTIFGQLINVLSSAIQNSMLYVEDSLVEQNKYTAQRKKSIYGLAKLSGYNPSLGTASGVQIKLSYIPNNEEQLSMIIKNKEKLTCSQNGLPYNIILPQEAIVMDIEKDHSQKFLYAVQGTFETQTFTSTGGQLYTKNVVFPGDMDVEYLEVKINGELWERVESLYDMEPDGKQYVCNTSLFKGVDLVFGNDQYGRALKDGDSIVVTYLLHDGELGNLDTQEEIYFTFDDNLSTISGEEVDGNNVFNISLATIDNVTAGTNSESKEMVREMIGYNSRALVLASADHYKRFINKFSFCGYNKTWSDPGSLIVNSLIIKDYTNNMKEGIDYFNLKESDFLLNQTQKNSLINCIKNSGHQLAGVTYNIYDPELCKYAIYIYIKLKSTNCDQTYVTNKVKQVVGEFFGNLPSDLYIPKSDISTIIKKNIPEVDGVDIYFLSERNEKALINKQYEDVEYYYDPSTNTYKKTTKMVYLYDGEDPGLGLDSHGNIYLKNQDQFPVIMGGWNYLSDKNSNSQTTIDDPIIINFY